MSSKAKKNSDKENEDIDVGRLIGEIIDHRKLIISTVSFFTFLSILYVLFATPIYQSDALIQVEQKQGNAILNNLSQILPDGQPQSAPEITLIRSRMILGKTVDDLNLQTIVHQRYFPIFGRGFARMAGDKPSVISISRLYVSKIEDETPILNVKIIDDDNYIITKDDIQLKGKVGVLTEKNGITIKIDKINAKPGDEFQVEYVSKLKAINTLQDMLTVSDQGKDTGMLVISLIGDEPDLIKDIVDSISNNYLAQNISRQAAQDEKSLEFLSKQLPKVRNDLNLAEDKLNAYRKQNDSVDLSLEAKSVLDQIVNVDNQLNELTFRESEISQLYTKEHPTYKALIEKRKTLQDEKNKLNKRVSAMPSTQQEILRLSRDVESGRAVYMQLLNRQQELSIAKSSAIGNVRIIDNAVTDPIPVKPQKVLLIISGFVFGIMISVGLILLRIFIYRGIESPEQLEELGINVYASIPISEASKNIKRNRGLRRNISKDNDKSLLALSNPADLSIEAIRGLRTSLHFAMMESKNNVLMISGASPNAGKTFVSSNLATIISQAGKKVLFIDADMRKGYTHKIFSDHNKSGLSDYLSGKIDIPDLIKFISEAKLDYISRGQVPPNPAELLMHKRFEELLHWAGSNYDIVIIDTPPILAVTDAAIIGSYVGTTLLIARFEMNTAKEIDVSIKRFEHSGVDVKGCILNGVVKKAAGYYSYGYNSYGYNYVDKK